MSIILQQLANGITVFFAIPIFLNQLALIAKRSFKNRNSVFLYIIHHSLVIIYERGKRMLKENNLPLIGGCSCGQVRYELTEKPLFTHACHCTDCQRSTGSGFVIHTLTIKSGFKITGETKSTTLPTGSGAGYNPHFCPKCGTFLWCEYHVAPKGFVVLRTGTLDKPNDIQPQAHIFTKQKLPWLSLPENVPHFPEMYNRNETWPKESNQRMDRLAANSSS